MDGDQANNGAEISRQLVSRILAGDLRAESELVHRYGQGLFTILLNESKDESLAKDIAQESWELLLSNIRNNKLRNPEKLRAYIIQTAKNRLLMHYRKHSSRQHETDEQLANLEDRTASPDSDYYKVQQKRKIEDVLLQLNKRDSLILRESYIKGTEKNKLCDILELSKAHYDRVLYRARKRFHKIWLEDYGENESFN